MAIEKVIEPQEFLVVWRDGKYSGAHTKQNTVYIEDGVRGQTIYGDAQPIGEGIPKGFPLAAVLEQIHVTALLQAETAQADCKAKAEECAKHEATIATLQAKIVELEKVPA